MPSKNPSKKHLLVKNLLRTLLRSVRLHDPLGVRPILSGEQISLPPSNLNLTSALPQLDLIGTSQFKLCFVRNLEPRFANHGLQTLGLRIYTQGVKYVFFLPP